MDIYEIFNFKTEFIIYTLIIKEIEKKLIL